MHKKALLYLVLLVGISLGRLEAQQMEYDIVVAGMETGTLKVHKTQEGSIVRIGMHTEASMNYLLGKTEASFESSNVFVQGKLEGCYATNVRDGEEIRFTRLMCSNGLCEVETKEGKRKLSPQPKTCIAAIFFEEPKGLSQIFSEDWGRYLPIEAMGNGRYLVTMPDGKTNEYIYQNGLLEELRSSTPIGKARIKRRK